MLALGDPGGDELLLAFLLARLGQHLGREGGREDDHAVGIADHDVAGLDRHPGAGHRDVGFPGHVAPAEDGRVDGRMVDGDLQPGQHRAVPDRAVGDDPAAPRTWARSARMSPIVPAVVSPRASMTSTSPGRISSMARLLRVHPAAVTGRQVLAQRQVAHGPA